MLKRILRSQAFARTLGGAVGAYMRLCDATTRWEVRNAAAVEPFAREGRPVILAVWHGRLMQMHKSWPRDARFPAHVLISQSREGEVVAAATRFLGYEVVRGSSAKAGKSKGTLPALRDMLKRLAEGHAVAITPDGPKGPRMRFGIGPIQLARMSGAPILPFTWATRSARALDSWDRFLMPAPFARGVCLFGPPIHAARDLDDAALEALRQRVEDELNRLTLEADRWAGRDLIAPAALSREAPAAP